MIVGDVTFGGSISGLTREGGAIGPVPVQFAMADQRYVVEAKDFRVDSGKTIGVSGVPLVLPAIPAGLAQTFFLIKSDLPILFQLNGGVPTYTIAKPGGLFCMSPGFPVTAVEFGNSGAEQAKVYVLQAVGA